MKRKSSLFLIFLFLLTLFFPRPRPLARAETVYACATQEDTAFFSAPDETTALFLLPQSYYVKVLARGTEYTYVQYLENVSQYRSVFGYCKTDDLLFVDYLPLNPYLYRSYTVTYSMPDFSLTDDTLSSFSYPCVYYGAHPVQKQTLAYVLVNGTFGYLPTPENFSYERNTDYLDYLQSLQPEPPPSEPLPDSPSPDSAQTITLSTGKIVAVAGGICLLLLVGCIFLAFYKNGKKKTYYYDD